MLIREEKEDSDEDEFVEVFGNGRGNGVEGVKHATKKDR